MSIFEERLERDTVSVGQSRQSVSSHAYFDVAVERARHPGIGEPSAIAGSPRRVTGFRPSFQERLICRQGSPSQPR